MGELAALAASLLFAVSSIVDKSLTTRFTPIYHNAFRAAGAGIFNAFIFISLGKLNEVNAVAWGAVGLMAAAAVSNIVIGDSLYLRFIRAVDISTAMALALALITMLSVGVGYLFLNENVTLFTLLGALLVVLGIYLLNFAQRKNIDPRKALALGYGGLLYLLMTSGFWVSGITMMSVALRDTDIYTGATTRALTVTPILFLMAWLGFDRHIVRGKETAVHQAFRTQWITGALQPKSEQNLLRILGNPLTRIAGGAHVRGGLTSRGTPAYERRSLIFRGSLRSLLVPHLLAGLSGVMHFGLGSYLLFFALQRSGAAVSVILVNSSLVWVVPLSFLFLKERPAGKAIVGMISTTGGIVLVVL